MVKIYQSPEVNGIKTGYQALRSKAPKTKKAVASGAIAIIAGVATLLAGPRIFASFAFDAVLGGIFVVGVGGAKLKLITHTSDKEYGQKLTHYLKYNLEASDLVARTYDNLEECARNFIPIGPLFASEHTAEILHDTFTYTNERKPFAVSVRERVPYRRIDHAVGSEQFTMLARVENGEKIIEFFTDTTGREKRIAELYRRPMQKRVSNVPKQLVEGSVAFYTPYIDGAKGKVRSLLSEREFALEYNGAISDLHKTRNSSQRFLTTDQIKQDRAAYEQTVLDIEGPKTRFERLSKHNGMFPLASIDSKGRAYLQFFESQTARQRYIADAYTER